MLNIEHVTKTYRSAAAPALDDINFSVRKGEFVALLGQNGAGKSTLINVLSGNVKKDGGRVAVGGFDLDTEELKTKNIIGVVPQEISFDFIFTVNEVLRNQSGYFGLGNNQRYIDQLLDDLSLKSKKSLTSRTLSGGMKRRLLIAKALVHRPRLLILDEPTAGVDIELRLSLYAYLKRLHAGGTTIILTTHYLEEAERLCDRVIVIDRGRLIVDESKDLLMKTFGSQAHMEFRFDRALDSEALGFLSDYSPQISEGTTLKLKAEKNDIGRVFRKMEEQNMSFTDFNMKQQKLEDVFLQLIER